MASILSRPQCVKATPSDTNVWFSIGNRNTHRQKSNVINLIPADCLSPGHKQGKIWPSACLHVCLWHFVGHEITHPTISVDKISGICDWYFTRKPLSGELCAVHYPTVYPKKYAHGFVVLCFVVVIQSLIMNSYEVFIHIHQGCFAGTWAIVRLPQCQWSKPDGYGKIGQCITTTKHSKAETVCIFLGIYCITWWPLWKRLRP